MERIKLEASERQETGKGAMRRLRALGQMPAVVYGSESTPTNLQLVERTLDHAVAHGVNRLIDLTVGSQKPRLVLVKDLQRDPLTQKLVHADFFQVDTKQKIHVSIPVHYLGRPKGVIVGGVFETLLREVAAECLPLEIPDAFELDVSDLDIGDALHVSDITVPDGVDLLTALTETAVHVVAPRVVEEPTEDEEDVAADGEAPAAEGEAPAAETKEGASE